MKYTVMIATRPRSLWDDSISGPYTGNEYDSREKAEKERKKALKEPDIDNAWIEEKE